MRVSKRPNLFLIAGPNGAGKTTTALSLLPNELKLYEFVNADEIARGLSPLNPASVNEMAGRLMVERIRSLIEHNTSFAFESTLAGTAWLRRVREARSAGFQTHLLFLHLKNAQMACKRVQSRVSVGGHDVPPSVIRRRFLRGLRNLATYYHSEFSTVLICDNSGGISEAPRTVLRTEETGNVIIFDHTIWNSILKKSNAKKT